MGRATPTGTSAASGHHSCPIWNTCKFLVCTCRQTCSHLVLRRRPTPGDLGFPPEAVLWFLVIQPSSSSCESTNLQKRRTQGSAVVEEKSGGGDPQWGRS